MKWMKKLAAHYNQYCRAFPDQKLIIIIDIDRTILDLRCHMLYLLQTYDQLHGTEYFKNIEISDLKLVSSDIYPLLDELDLPKAVTKSITKWYEQYHYSAATMLESYRPLQGVMELIRWLQLQPHTFIGLNSSRPESLRTETLFLLNKLGNTFKVKFEDEMLYLNPMPGLVTEIESKVAGIQYFQRQGYQVVAVIDNNPANLHAMSEIMLDQRILMLHTDTVFSAPDNSPLARNSYYQTDRNQCCQTPPDRHVQFVWHGILDNSTIDNFLATNINWVEVDVRIDWIGDQVIIRSDSFESVPMREDEEFIKLNEVLLKLRPTPKSIKIDLREGMPLLHKIVEILKAHSFADRRLWFNAKIDKVGETGFRLLKRHFPNATIQTPVDFIKPLILGMPDRASQILDELETWGINRFSAGWKFSTNRDFIRALKMKGYEVNIYNVPDFESFLQASLLGPDSITSDFNYPAWHSSALYSDSL